MTEGASSDDDEKASATMKLEAGPLACRLPFPLLLEIFWLAVERDPLEGAFGGRLVRWDCHRSVQFMPLVCKAWLDAATAVLYQSVALFGGHAARLFLRTIRQSPVFALQVRTLVLGLEDSREESEDATGLVEDSLDLTRVLALCPNVQHLHLRPLHTAAREPLLAALATKQLVSLVCAPRLHLSEHAWGQGLYLSTDMLVTSTMKSCEFEFGRMNPPPEAYDLPPSSLPPPFLPLVELRLQCEMSTPTLCAILSSCHRLEVLELYVERLMPTDVMSAALASSQNTMKRLVFLCNPTYQELERLTTPPLPLFDPFLVNYPKLGQLRLSSTELSSIRILTDLPPQLFHLEIRAFNSSGAFTCSRRFLDMLSDVRQGDVQLKELKSIAVHDSRDVWSKQDLQECEQAFRRRGVVFTFQANG